MARGPSTFKKHDVTRLVRAVKDEGLEVARVEVGKDGRISVVTGKPEAEGGQGDNEWDKIE